MTPTKAHRAHRHSNTSPVVPVASSTPSPTHHHSGAHVVGIDIPSSPTSPPPANPQPGPPQPGFRRSSSMTEVARDMPTSRRELTYPSRGGVVSRDESKKPKRSNSLTFSSRDERAGSGAGSNVDLVDGGSVSSAYNHTHQYPLRETVSLSQLPGGGYAGSTRPHGGVSGTGGRVVRGAELSHMTSKSVSMQNIPSGRGQSSAPPPAPGSSNQHRKDRHRVRSSHTHQGGVNTLPSHRDKKVSCIIYTCGPRTAAMYSLL